eukprot:2635139-Rhodomonas_salina.1
MDSDSHDSDPKDADSTSDSDAPITPLHSPQPMPETPPTCPRIQLNDWKLEEEATELAGSEQVAVDDKYLLECQNKAQESQREAERSAARAKLSSTATMARVQVTPQTNSTVTTLKDTEADTTWRLANWRTSLARLSSGVTNHLTAAMHVCWLRTCTTPSPDRQEPQALTDSDMDVTSPGSMAAQTLTSQTDQPTLGLCGRRLEEPADNCPHGSTEGWSLRIGCGD